MLFGESIVVLDHCAEWSQIRAVNDGYEGFIETSTFEITETTSTHWVCTKATFVFEKPDIKGTVTRRLLFGSELTVDAANVDGKFVQLAGGGFVWQTHCLQKNSVLQSTMIETAHSNYQHTPYLWGGRSSDGCDCSGLVQMLAMATGVSLPRDSVDQEKALTENIEFQNRTAEDLVFWAGHVGVLMSPDLLLHSTAHSMRCCVEPLQDVIQRAGSPVSIKRIGR